ncbi:hypothetical protein [Persicirhabdus sediminis]|uniref:Uncharacterized protein n=1 Tax=Persicirhabdus sediminis TaxID=454144 RepID=A0A8J7MH69_9BACT|nr:hypothetical protein [Persicirhabdus sediminis]MBK1792872.1 hypothetical protein [Persicirhabdus sediminis]
MNRTEIFSAGAAVLAGLAVVVAVWPKDEPAGEQQTLQRIQQQVDKLERNINRLEARMGQTSYASSAATADNSQSSQSINDNSAGGSVADLAVRQNELEQRLESLGVLAHFEAMNAKVDEAYQKALDEEMSKKDRLEALALLKEEGRIDEAVVSSMMDLWDGLADDKSTMFDRWMLMENLRGVNDERLRNNLLEVLDNEPGPKMTSQVLSTLEPMLPDPAISEWLNYLSENSTEASVQKYANEVLSRAANKE